MMNKKIFIDTSAWYALADANDRNHASAKAFIYQALDIYDHFATSNCVIGETYTLMRRRLGYKEAWEFIKSIKSSPRLEIIFINEEIERGAYKILRHFKDQDFSYVDGVSFAVMKDRKIKEAFAYDEHFSIIGFTRLPYIK
jgi:predicted nucleic acid-binding protein